MRTPCAAGERNALHGGAVQAVAMALHPAYRRRPGAARGPEGRDRDPLRHLSSPGGAAGAALGLGYIALHFAWVIGAPTLALGAGVFWALSRRFGA
jgi:hypothetical protein